MKKIKLLTSTALLGMTAGIVLPMVTSCSQYATGTIKLKLADGITAATKDFKIGDKVVITYTIEDEDLVVTSSNITVKFDGWIVKSSRKTWRHDPLKKQIIIYSAPTTDISIKIGTNSYTPVPEGAPINFVSAECEYSLSRNGIDYTNGIVATLGSNILDVLSTYTLDNETGWEFVEWRYSNDVTIGTHDTLDYAISVYPHFEETGTEPEPTKVEVPLKLKPDTATSLPLGRYIQSGQPKMDTSYAMNQDDYSNMTLPDFADLLLDEGVVKPLPGCTFDAWYYYQEGEEDPWVPFDYNVVTSVAQAIAETSSNIYMGFKADVNQTIAYFSYDQDNNVCFIPEAQILGRLGPGALATLILDTSILPDGVTIHTDLFNKNKDGNQFWVDSLNCVYDYFEVSTNKFIGYDGEALEDFMIGPLSSSDPWLNYPYLKDSNGNKIRLNNSCGIITIQIRLNEEFVPETGIFMGQY